MPWTARTVNDACEVTHHELAATDSVTRMQTSTRNADCQSDRNALEQSTGFRCRVLQTPTRFIHQARFQF